MVLEFLLKLYMENEYVYVPRIVFMYRKTHRVIVELSGLIFIFIAAQTQRIFT